MKKTLNKLIDDNLYNTFIYDPKKQLLDPLSTMAKIIELYFRPIGTKFGINDHSITIDMPSENNTKYWYNIKNYQSCQRYWNADSRENISKLGIVIIRLIEWYILPTYQLVKNNKRINTKNLEASIQINCYDNDEVLILWKCLDELTNYFCLALEKLIETYIEGNVVWALQNYINLINDSKKGKYNSTQVPSTIIKNDVNFIDYEKIKSLWSLKTIQEIHELYNKCYTIWSYPEKNENLEYLNGTDLSCLKKKHELDLDIDNNINNKIISLNKILTIDEALTITEKEKRVESYLAAIKVFIDMINNDFRELIAKSTGT
jgi:hypothetical protein